MNSTRKRKVVVANWDIRGILGTVKVHEENHDWVVAGHSSPIFLPFTKGKYRRFTLIKVPARRLFRADSLD